MKLSIIWTSVCILLSTLEYVKTNCSNININTGLCHDYVPQCGRSHLYGVGIRVQGFEGPTSVHFGEWPHFCAILETVGNLNYYRCGGSLIAPGVVLTAAHCVQRFKLGPSNLQIRCGDWDTSRDSEPFPHQNRGVEAVYTHPDFEENNGQFTSDIGLVFTSEHFVLLGMLILPVCQLMIVTWI